MQAPYKIIIAGGGTGGHIFPAIAIGHALRVAKPGTELLFVGALGKMEMEKVPQEGFNIIGLDIAGFNRSNLLKNISLPWKLISSAWRSRKILSDFKPHAVVGVGGYASFPVLRAAQYRGIPTIIQEQNSYAGKSNRILGKKAKAICVAYEEVKDVFPESLVKVTGNPVRKSIANLKLNKEEGCSLFKLDASRKTVLIVGGSLGAKSINETVATHLKAWLDWGVNIIWQTGKPFHEEGLKLASLSKDRLVIKDFIREMDYAYAAADIIISRAGASAISELCIVGKPVIFVPFPFAAEDHQTKNAAALVTRHAGLLIPNDQVGTQLSPLLQQLLQDEQQAKTLGENIALYAVRNADELIANEIFKVALTPEA